MSEAWARRKLRTGTDSLAGPLGFVLEDLVVRFALVPCNSCFLCRFCGLCLSLIMSLRPESRGDPRTSLLFADCYVILELSSTSFVGCVRASKVCISKERCTPDRNAVILASDTTLDRNV